MLVYILPFFGRVAERLKAAVSKTAIGETLSRVRIPPLPLEPRESGRGGMKTVFDVSDYS